MNLSELDNHSCTQAIKAGTHYIWDHPQTKKGEFIKENDQWTLKIDHRSENPVYFTQMEDCVMNSTTKQCDWAFFDQSKIYFVEAKDVKNRGRKNQRKEAKDKFKAVRSFFGESFTSEIREVHAILNFRTRNIVTGAAHISIKDWYRDQLNMKYEELNYLEFKD